MSQVLFLITFLSDTDLFYGMNQCYNLFRLTKTNVSPGDWGVSSGTVTMSGSRLMGNANTKVAK
jgi:hypothetical protein